MIALEQAAVDYLTLRRAFGYKLVGHDRLLADFCRHCSTPVLTP